MPLWALSPPGSSYPCKQPQNMFEKKLSCFISQDSSTSNQQAPSEYATEDPIRHSIGRAFGHKVEK